jgi:hypothetical protein
LQLWLTSRDLDRVRATGARIHYAELADTQNGFPDDAELVIVRVPLDLRSVHKLDGEVLTPDGRLVKAMPDIHFDPADGAIYACCEADLARTAASSRMISRLYATDDSGRRLVLEM